MFVSLLGVRLILWMGKVVPTPPPFGMLDALTEVEVTNDDAQGDGFRLVFTLSKELLDYGLVASGVVDPFTRVIVGVAMGVTPEVLIDGIITHHQLAPSDDPGKSTLTVMGRDLSVMMNLEEKNDKFENQPDFVIFSRLIAGYAQYGIFPLPTPTTDIPIMLMRTPRQTETDLQLIQRMAHRNGYVFYIEPVTFFVNKAYFGPAMRGGFPQPGLTLNMGSSTNLTSIHFRNDALAPVGSKGTFVEPFTKMTLPLPPLPSLRIPPLALFPTAPRRTALTRDSAKKNPIQAGLAGLAASMNAPDPVEGSGEVDGVRYGSVLRARGIVGVRGVGYSYDGTYYVKSVTHHIKRGSYTQKFTLKREGTGATLPVVRP